MSAGCKKIDGCHQIPLPWKEEVAKDMPKDSEVKAKKRILSLQKKFERSPDYAERYKSEMKKLISDGKAEVVPDRPEDRV